jgi:hypothetical protein
MKNNLFVKILNEWENCDELERFKLLQEFENENAERQNRNARTLMIDVSAKPYSENNEAAAYYCLQYPEYIFICSPAKTTAFISMLDLTHEGLHAYIDDYLNDKTNLITLSKIDIENITKENEYLKIINKYLEKINSLKVYETMSFEEIFVYNETALIMLSHIFNSCESIMDTSKLFKYVQDTLKILINQNNEIENLKAQGLDYQLFYEHVINYDKNMTEKFKKEIKTTKIVEDEKDILLVKILNKLYGEYKSYLNCSKKEKEIKKDQFIDLYLNLAYLYSDEKGSPLLCGEDMEN